MRSKLTDDEFIERIRRTIPTNRKLAIGMSVCYAVMLTAVLVYAPRYFQSFRQLAPDANAYEIGFRFGLFLGATVGGATIALIWQLVHSLITAFGPSVFRIPRLLLKYYDFASNRSPEAATK